MVSVDQMGNKVELPSAPKRIVSLVPSQTELLSDLGLDDEVVGITKFCVHPPHWRKTKAIVGGTKQFDMAAIDALHPDLIIGNKEENYREGIEALQKRYPVWMSDLTVFPEALAMIVHVALITGRLEEGGRIVREITMAFGKLRTRLRMRTLYLIWRNPWIGVASGTFIHSMLQKAGFANVLGKEKRYPELSPEEIRNLNPELVMLSSEPFPFAEKHIAEISALVPGARVILVDGEMFSWYGSRLALAPDYINSLQIES